MCSTIQLTGSMEYVQSMGEKSISDNIGKENQSPTLDSIICITTVGMIWFRSYAIFFVFNTSLPCILARYLHFSHIPPKMMHFKCDAIFLHRQTKLSSGNLTR